jgi:RimJ/RimL family protein N-acetyltransferase
MCPAVSSRTARTAINRSASTASTGHHANVEPTEITAGTLLLRPFRPSDIPEVHAACQDPALQRWVPVPVPYTRADAEEFVGRTCPTGWDRGEEATFAVLDAVSARLLGCVALHGASRADGLASIGFWCAPEARGRGVTTQAVRVVCRWAFAACDRARIEWYAEVGNHASRRVAEKAGFTIEGVLRSRLLHRGRRTDAWIGSLLRRDLDL